MRGWISSASASVLVSMVLLTGCKTQNENASLDTGSQSAQVTTPANAAPSDTTRGLRVGDHVPDALLATIDGREMQLGDIVGRAPLILTFYRGGWCPYCQGQLTEWQGRIDEVRALGSELIAITPEAPSKAQATMNEHDLGFPILSDIKGQAAAGFDLGFELDQATQKRYKGFGINLPAINAREDWNLVIPATYVVDADGIIRYAYINEDYTKRADPDEVLDALAALE
jgi:peroxiredoxin